MTGILARGARAVAAAVTAAVAFASPASAQSIVASSFDQMKLIARLGDTLTVADHSGQHVTGRLADLSSSSVVLLVNGTRREIDQRDVSTIRQRRFGSPRTGATIGLAIGMALGVLGELEVRSECPDCRGLVAAGAVVYGGLGAGIGAGVAALTTHEALIYSRAPESARVTVRPFATPARRGVAVSVGF